MPSGDPQAAQSQGAAPPSIALSRHPQEVEIICAEHLHLVLGVWLIRPGRMWFDQKFEWTLVGRYNLRTTVSYLSGRQDPIHTRCCCSYLDCPKATHIPRNRKLQSTKRGTNLNDTTGKVAHNELVMQDRNYRRILLCTHFSMWAWCWRSLSWLQICWLLFFSSSFFQPTFSRNRQINTEYRLKLGSFLNMQLVITLSEMKNCR